MPADKKELIFAVFIASFILLILSALVILLIYNYFRVRSAREKDILKAVFQTQESEQNRISEDLHDDIGGKLSALKLQNELLLTDDQNEENRELVKLNSELIDRVVKDIRLIVRNQSSKYLLQNGLPSELTSICYQYKKLKGIAIELDIKEFECQLLPDFQVALFRVLQELLHNSIKHSNASLIKIQFIESPDILEINYSDNGKGFETKDVENAGMGMKNIRTRIRLYNGQVTFNSSPGVATLFHFQFEMQHIS
ncbi:MAG: hypothetical protein IPP71_10525 [Bacteroidetes bacterium]|nr:hypothetical protein [Bacteroidota bacterium]